MYHEDNIYLIFTVVCNDNTNKECKSNHIPNEHKHMNVNSMDLQKKVEMKIKLSRKETIDFYSNYKLYEGSSKTDKIFSQVQLGYIFRIICIL